ncbi:hypothetical protein K470DRAFT_154564 [Piedraia hortae CBS 480.64]|uniref:Uncharacterized protein n=1 Tax=Piedraia hortae CBS 480.64 TaxID=1314780 RepID=A0A6A7C5U4_9PEZI|nr:hypothetical protein K470DRAFT_154564 [Piedraia hortae CBS 480.64]
MHVISPFAKRLETLERRKDFACVWMSCKIPISGSSYNRLWFCFSPSCGLYTLWIMSHEFYVQMVCSRFPFQVLFSFPCFPFLAMVAAAIYCGLSFRSVLLGTHFVLEGPCSFFSHGLAVCNVDHV